jgi:hypothetical protein
MRRVVIAGVLAVCLMTPLLVAQQNNAGSAAVRKAIEDHYFKAHATGSGDYLKGMFIDDGRK